MAYYRHQVTPFGNLRIKAHLRLPEAYRSLARPSSPVSTKASTVCPLKLDSNFEISHAASSHSFEQPSPRFADLAACLLPGTCMPDFAVKITFVFGIRIYFQDRARMARLELTLFVAVRKKYFSMWMSKSGLRFSLKNKGCSCCCPSRAAYSGGAFPRGHGQRGSW